LAQIASSIRNDVDLIVFADELLDDALKISPKRQQLLFSSAILKMRLGDNKKAETLLQEAILNDPEIAESWARLIAFYSQIGEKEKVVEVMKKAEEDYGHRFTVDENGSLKQIK
jgi:tetratricopeptide (TPR) repeat protein